MKALHLIPGFALFASIAAATTVFWTGDTDTTWSQPDATSWDTPYDNGYDVEFGNTGVGTITLDLVSLTPASISFSHTAGTYAFLAGGGNIAATGALSISGPGTVQFGNLTNGPLLSTWTTTSVGGGGTLAFTRPGGFIGSSAATVTLDGGTLKLATDNSASYTANNPFSIGAGGGTVVAQFSGNVSIFSLSGGFSGSADLMLQTTGSAGNYTGAPGLRIVTADNSGYAGTVHIVSNATQPNANGSGAVTFGDAANLFSGADVLVYDGGVIGFAFSPDDTALANVTAGPRGGIGVTGSANLAGLTNIAAHVGKGGVLLLDNRDTIADRIGDSQAVALASSRLLLVGRNANNNLVNETIGNFSYSGSGRLTLDRLQSTNAGAKLTVSGTLATPSAGNTLLIDVNNTTDEYGAAAGDSNLIVTGTKPAVSNGMVSPGIQYYPGGNILGHFMTFSGDDLVKASYNAEFDSGSAVEIANVTVATNLAADEEAHAVRCSSIDLNLGGFTLYITGGGLMHGGGGKTISNGRIDFGATPAFLGMFNAAAQTNISAKISGSGGVTVLGTGQSVNLINNSNDFTGGLFINGATVALSTSATNGNNVTVNAFGRLTVHSGSASATIGGLSGDGRVAAFFQGNNTTSATLVIAPASGTHAFGGRIANGDAGRVLSVTKDGNGTQVFGSDSVGLYDGTTTVANGTLLVDGDLSGATGPVNVTADGVLGGTGRIGGATTIADGGKLAFTLSTPAASHDKLEIVNALTFEGASELVLAVSGTAAAGTYTLVSTNTPITGVAPATVTAPGGWSGTAYPDGNDLKLDLSATGASPYDTWASGFSLSGPNAAKDFDYDKDGVLNLDEFALDSDPTDPGERGLLFAKLATIGAESDVLTLTIAARSGAAFAADGNNQVAVVAADSLTYSVQAADDLSAWGSALVSEITGGDAAAIQAGLPAPDAGWSYKTFRSDGYGGGDATDFIRVEVTSP